MATRAQRLDDIDIDLTAPPPAPPSVLGLVPDPEEAALDAEIVELGDGSAEYLLEPEPQPIPPDLPFMANLALYIPEQDLTTISAELLEAVSEDVSSATEYRRIIDEGRKYLGLTYEKRTYPFQDACGTYDTLLLEAIIRQQAMERGELLPARGPVLTEVIGMENDQVAQTAWRVREFFNYYLTEVATEYYPDSDKMSFAKGEWGSVFRKVYFDPRLGRPTARYLTPKEFVVSYTTRDLDTAPRTTEYIWLTPREMVGLQLSGFYRDVELAQPDEENLATEGSPPTTDTPDKLIGIRPDMGENDDRHVVLEIHTDWDLVGFEHMLNGAATGYPLPYVISIDLLSRKILSIRRNWKESDPLYRKIKWYVHHMMVPGDGFYGYGFIHLLFGTTRATTMMLRQNVDAGTLANFPGGLRVKGVRTENSTILIGPMEFPEVETGGLPIRDAISPLPYKGPSEFTMLQRDKMREEARQLGNTAELAVGDGRQDAPVGTTVALLEQATKIQTAVMKRARVAYREEFRIFKRLFKEHLPVEGYPFPVKGSQAVCMCDDFNDNVDVIPVADPNVSSAAQRQMRAQMALQLSGALPPGTMDQRVAASMVLDEMDFDIQDIERLMPLPQQAKPLDPVSENQLSMIGKPLAVGLYQDDESHIQVHIAAIQAPGMADHIQTHFGNHFRKQIEQAIGQPLPPLGTPMPPEVENQIAFLAAQAMAVVKQQQQQGALDPMQVALEQVKVDAADVQAKLRIAQQKDATERFKALLDYKSDMTKIHSQQRTERIKAFAQIADNTRPANPDAERVWQE